MHKTLGAVSIAAAVTFLNAAPAASQTKVVQKVLINNAYVRVLENHYAPGAVNPMAKRPNVVVYVISGPYKAKNVYADGHSTVLTYPTGAVFFQAAGTREITNVGPNAYTSLAVQLKK